MSEFIFTEGVCDDGAAILMNGNPLSIGEIVALLNQGASSLDSMQPVGRRLTEEEAAMSDGKAGNFIWWKTVPPGCHLFCFDVDEHQAP